MPTHRFSSQVSNNHGVIGHKLEVGMVIAEKLKC